MRTVTSLTATDRVLGGLMGVAIGDALGATCEFESAESIHRKYGIHREITGGGSLKWRPGQPTDDTDQMLIVARALLDGGGPVRNVARGLVAWKQAGPSDIGTLTRTAVMYLERGVRPTHAGTIALQHTRNGGEAGNGSLMRTLPIALGVPDQRKSLALAAEVSRVTHADRRCVQACQAYGVIAQALMAGQTGGQAVDTAIDWLDAQKRPEHEVRWALCVAQTMIPTPKTMWTGGYVIDSLRAAAWAVQQDRPAPDTLVHLVNLGHDADTTGAIAGGLLGTRWGLSCWPWRWISKLETQVEVAAVSRRLAARWDAIT